MSTQTFTRVKIFSSLLVMALSFGVRAEDWKVDFSRRFPQPSKDEIREPASSDRPVAVDPQPEVSPVPLAPEPIIQKEESAGTKPTFFDAIFTGNDPAQEIVVLNTEKGFIPSQVRVREGSTYKFYIVNVNEKEKNVSFVLDSFSEHHATYYGQIKTFMIRPQKEGVYRFMSPETSAQGKLVVAPLEKNGRLPASTP